MDAYSQTDRRRARLALLLLVLALCEGATAPDDAAPPTPGQAANVALGANP